MKKKVYLNKSEKQKELLLASSIERNESCEYVIQRSSICILHPLLKPFPNRERGMIVTQSVFRFLVM